MALLLVAQMDKGPNATGDKGKSKTDDASARSVVASCNPKRARVKDTQALAEAVQQGLKRRRSSESDGSSSDSDSSTESEGSDIEDVPPDMTARVADIVRQQLQAEKALRTVKKKQSKKKKDKKDTKKKHKKEKKRSKKGKDSSSDSEDGDDTDEDDTKVGD